MTVPGALALSALFLMTAPTLGAQLISIKTVPIAQGDQFNLFPSLNQGMGGVAIGLPDTLLDPFRNPAKGGRLSRSQDGPDRAGRSVQPVPFAESGHGRRRDRTPRHATRSVPQPRQRGPPLAIARRSRSRRAISSTCSLR